MRFGRANPFRAAIAVLCTLSAAAVRGEEESSFPPWKGHEDRIEQALLEGEVVAMTPIGRGITNPFRVELVHRGQRFAAAFKPIDEAARKSIRESYRAEIAAYRLSRLLGLDKVPPTVERRIRRNYGSLQFWVDDAQIYDEVSKELTRGPRFNEERWRMRLFDQIIDNPDRNAGNFMVDQEQRIILIDHSRAFAFDAYSRSKRKDPPARFDRALVDRLRTLELGELEAALRKVLPKHKLKSVLRARDRFLRHVDQLVEERGKIVFYENEASAARDGGAL